LAGEWAEARAGIDDYRISGTVVPSKLPFFGTGIILPVSNVPVCLTKITAIVISPPEGAAIWVAPPAFLRRGPAHEGADEDHQVDQAG
jgi:hypothetical protein